MIVLRSVLSATLVCAQFVVATRGACTGGTRLVFATGVAAVMVVHVVGLVFNVVVVVAYLVSWVLPALIIGMLAVAAM